jgi:hypothetical protein
MRYLGRRAFLILAGLLAPFGVRRSSAQSISVADFVRLSTRLTGRSALDREMASAYLRALLTVPGNAPLLAALSKGALARTQMTPAHVALEQDILISWYTGTHRVDGQTRLATYTGALKWSAIGRPAPGTCVLPAGSWSVPPQTQR